MQILSTTPIASQQSQDFLIIDAPGWDDPSWNPGFFCCFGVVIGGLNHFEQNNYAGCKVNFNNGLYFDPKIGPNWWEYYFEPIKVGNQENTRIVHADHPQQSLWAVDAISTISRSHASGLIAKYIKLKPHMLEKINNFTEEYFDDHFVIGIHYRGTDKKLEAHRVSYETVYLATEKVIKELPNDTQYTVFIASDEQPFIDYMTSKFGRAVCSIDAIRSTNGNPVHHQNDRPLQSSAYKQGEESVIDCFLLSRTNILIRTQSNLSTEAANINADLLTINLTYPNGRQYATKERLSNSRIIHVLGELMKKIDFI